MELVGLTGPFQCLSQCRFNRIKTSQIDTCLISTWKSSVKGALLLLIAIAFTIGFFPLTPHPKQNLSSCNFNPLLCILKSEKKENWLGLLFLSHVSILPSLQLNWWCISLSFNLDVSKMALFIILSRQHSQFAQCEKSKTQEWAEIHPN